MAIGEKAYLVQKKHLKYFTHKNLSPKTVDADFVRVLLSANDIEHLSKNIHFDDHQCGGFMAVDEEASLEQLKREIKTAKLTETAENEFSTLEPRFPTQVQQLFSQLQQEDYINYVRQLSQFNDRSARTQNGVQASEWIKEKLESFKLEFHRENMDVFFVETPRYNQKSIVVKLSGSKSNLPAVVLGGHMDTLSSNKPGADDDASGSSTLFEIIHKLLKTNTQLQRDTYFIFYAAEEVGLVGSKAVVEYFSNNNISVRAVMQLDMTGYAVERSKGKIFFVTDYTNNALTLYTKKLAKTYLGKTDNQILDLRCNYACSDHARWTNKGFPAVFPFESLFQDYNPDIHTSRDTLSTVSAEHAFQFVKLAGAFVIELGEPNK